MTRRVEFEEGDRVVAMVPSHLFALPLYGEITATTKTTIHVRWDTLDGSADEVIKTSAARRDGFGVVGPDGFPKVSVA